jgi:3-phosphoshikimate 1-carboxyvinyltransferase
VGRVDLPGDKSISHRAVLLSLLASGPARVRGLQRSGDLEATLRAAQALGGVIQLDGDDHVITPPQRLTSPKGVIDCGNSGTTLRLLAGLIAGTDAVAVLSGDRSLRGRPMSRIADPLRIMGARIDGREGGRYAPLVVRGPVERRMGHHLPISSAQVKSALLLAGRHTGVSVKEPRKSRDHTERLLERMGARLSEVDGWLHLEPVEDLAPVDVDVPRDLSAAAFWLVAASIVPGSDITLPGVGVNPTRTGVIDVLNAMGASIEVTPVGDGPEPTADLRVRHAPLAGVRIEGELALRSLDELPALAVAAAFASGETVIGDAAELRVKESDRIGRTVAGLLALGVEVEASGDGMIIQGGRPSGPAVIDGSDDHRIAMAFSVAGLASGPVTISGADAVRSSYPAFRGDLEALSAA